MIGILKTPLTFSETWHNYHVIVLIIFTSDSGGDSVGAVGAIAPTVFEETSIVTYDLHPQFWRRIDY